MSTVACTQKRRAAGAVPRKTLDREHDRISSRFTTAEEEIEYYKRTGHILYHYFTLVDHPPAAQPQPGAPKAGAAGDARAPRNSILDMLNDSSQTTREVDVFDDAEDACSSAFPRADGGDSFGPHKCVGQSRAELLESFRCALDAEYVPSTRAVVDGGGGCGHCGHEELVLVSSDGVSTCPECGTVEKTMVQGERPNYRDPPRETVYFCYKRGNHFQEWISQTQGREHTSIPDSVYDAILTELKKQKITNMATLKVRKLREVMKKLQLNRFFEHIPHILNHINGSSSVHIPPELEAQMRRMFQQIQAPFIRHAPPSRKNFLSYSYVLHKFAQLLGHEELLPHFPLLKSRLKLMQQDQIWRGICADLNWEFVPSL